MFSRGQNCSWVGNLSTKVFGDDGSSSWQLNIQRLRIQDSQQSLRRKSTERKKTCKHHPQSGKSQAYTDLKRNMRNKEIFIQEIHNINEGFFLIKKMWPKYSETR